MDASTSQICFVAYGASELGLSLLRRSKGGSQRKDQGTLGLIWAVIGLAITGAFTVAAAWPAGRTAPFVAAQGTGLFLFLAGVALRWWAILHLGRFFTVDVAITADQRVVDNGPYRLIRHPSYSGALLAFLGLGLMLGNWLSLLVLLVPILVAFLWRIQVEERALLAALGEGYRAYCGRTKRLLPFLF